MLFGVIVGSAGTKGRGVFATKSFRARDVVFRLGGERVGLARCTMQIALGRARLDDPLQITSRDYILLDKVSICFNHSCEPTCAIVGESDLVAMHDIEALDELTFDYSLTVRTSFYSWAWSMACACGAAGCRHRIGNIASVPRAQLQSLTRAKFLQDYMLDDTRLRRIVAAPAPAAR